MSHTATCEIEGPHLDPHDDQHDDEPHGHSHGLVDRSIVRSRDGIRTVAISFLVLTVAAVVQTVIFGCREASRSSQI
ncbi:MAG: hypothetical protein E6G08_20130 [Actinobacteria bacterium]|nr:MAG: hypothetical protein E6G08_20130 [Actinomycetota bacterium]